MAKKKVQELGSAVVVEGLGREVAAFLQDTPDEPVRAILQYLRSSPHKSKSVAAPAPATKEPSLLDADAVAKMLGLTDRKRPRQAVCRLHRTRQLVGVRVSRSLRWKIEDVKSFIERSKG